MDFHIFLQILEKKEEPVEHTTCMPSFTLFHRPTMGMNALHLQPMCLAKLQGISSLCVCALCMCFGYHSVVCIELNIELEKTSNLPLCSKDENLYSSENNPQFSAKERLGHACTVFFQPAQLHKYQVKSLCFVCFSFLSKNNKTLASQIWNISLL